MLNKDKNRDPERAKKRAVSDARCALRKLGIWGDLDALTQWAAGYAEHSDAAARIREALNLDPKKGGQG